VTINNITITLFLKKRKRKEEESVKCRQGRKTLDVSMKK
jgi:hypothetical protein